MATPAPRPLRLLSARRIWDHAPHNAFTDLKWFGGRWVCAFREGQGHVSPDGAMRIIESVDGERWTSAARLTLDGHDLRDAKLSVTPDGRLMLNGGAALHDASNGVTHRSLVWFSRDGRAWSEPEFVGRPNDWLWRVTWHEGVAYSLAYGCAGEMAVHLYHSRDGRQFDLLLENLLTTHEPSEHDLLFDADGSARMLVRREKGATPYGHAVLGRSEPPYKTWSWTDCGIHLGGPAMIRLPNGRILAAGRVTEPDCHTGLCDLDPATGKLTEALALPSGGDTSYPGLVWRDDQLWVTYYSSHEGKTAIYLARVAV